MTRARRAGTSRTTLSAYENGRKSPTVATFACLLAEAGCELAAQPQVTFIRQPARVAGGYEIVLQEGRPADILAYVDGTLLVALWDDLVLPRGGPVSVGSGTPCVWWGRGVDTWPGPPRNRQACRT